MALVWEEDLRQAGYDFSPLGCAVWVCIPGGEAARQAAKMIASNAAALAKAFQALPLAEPEKPAT